MGTLTLQYGILSYDDTGSSQPQVRNFDVSQSFQGLNANHENTSRVTLVPGDRQTVASTLRTLAQDSSTNYAVERPVSTDGRMRLRFLPGGSTAPLFRTPRSVGLSSATSVSLLRLGPATARLALPGCNTSSVVVGDFVRFERTTDTLTSVFSAPNQGQTWQIQAVGNGYVDFLDNGQAALDTAVTGADTCLSIMSAGPVHIGDSLTVAGVMNMSNQGDFAITDVASDYLEFVNVNGVVENFSIGSSNVVTVYDHKINFMHVTASGPVMLAINGGQPFALGSLGEGGPIVFLGSLQATLVEAVNSGTSPVVVTLRHAAVG